MQVLTQAAEVKSVLILASTRQPCPIFTAIVALTSSPYLFHMGRPPFGGFLMATPSKMGATHTVEGRFLPCTPTVTLSLYNFRTPSPYL
jgi:hypothetical protein